MKKMIIALCFVFITCFSIFAAKDNTSAQTDTAVTATYEKASKLVFSTEIPDFSGYPACYLGTLILTVGSDAEFQYNPVLIVKELGTIKITGENSNYSSTATIRVASSRYSGYKTIQGEAGKTNYITLATENNSAGSASIQGQTINCPIYLVGTETIYQNPITDENLKIGANPRFKVRISRKGGASNSWSQGNFVDFSFKTGTVGDFFPITGETGTESSSSSEDNIQIPIEGGYPLVLDFGITNLVSDFILFNAIGNKQVKICSLSLSSNKALDKGVSVSFKSQNDYKLVREGSSNGFDYTLKFGSTVVTEEAIIWTGISTNASSPTLEDVYVTGISEDVPNSSLAGEYSDTIIVTVTPND